jgi:CDP-diacylglycerol--serine O-phosphatidyltransferase
VGAFANTATAVTSVNLVTGFVAIVLAGEGRLREAAAAVVAAAVLDAADGLVARRMSVSGRFGCRLDSLADVVAFGAAPALMLEQGVLGTVPAP